MFQEIANGPNGLIGASALKVAQEMVYVCALEARLPKPPVWELNAKENSSRKNHARNATNVM